MPEVHVPDLDDHDEGAAPAASPLTPRLGGKSLLKIVLEVVLISLGVFLGLAGEQWRENAHQRELAHESLRRFRSEILTNRQAVEAVKDYHSEKLKELKEYLGADRKKREAMQMRFIGIRPPFFERTAWDLALATQSLAFIDSDLAFSISRVYITQGLLDELTRGVTQAMYLSPPGMNGEAFLQSVSIYYGDATVVEPRLLTMYDELLPQIDRALGESPVGAP